MYVIVVGGGTVGYYLSRDLVERGHEVTLIEKDGLLDTEMSLGHLQRDQVVLVIGRHGDDRVCALDAGLGEKSHLAPVASHHDAAELSLEPVRTPPILLDEGDLVATLDQVSRQVVADGSATD